MKPTCSGDMGVSPGPPSKAEGLGILTIWEPGPLGFDFWKLSRLTQRYTPTVAAHSHGIHAHHKTNTPSHIRATPSIPALAGPTRMTTSVSYSLVSP